MNFLSVDILFCPLFKKYKLSNQKNIEEENKPVLIKNKYPILLTFGKGKVKSKKK